MKKPNDTTAATARKGNTTGSSEHNTLVAKICGKLGHIPRQFMFAKENLEAAHTACVAVVEHGAEIGMTADQLKQIDTIKAGLADMLETIGFASTVASKIDCDVNGKPS